MERNLAGAGKQEGRGGAAKGQTLLQELKKLDGQEFILRIPIQAQKGADDGAGAGV